MRRIQPLLQPQQATSCLHWPSRFKKKRPAQNANRYFPHLKQLGSFLFAEHFPQLGGCELVRLPAWRQGDCPDPQPAAEPEKTVISGSLTRFITVKEEHDSVKVLGQQLFLIGRK